MAHNDFKMKVHIVFCPNVSPKSEEGKKYTFEDRPFFHTDDRVDPGDPVAFEKLHGMETKNYLLHSVKQTDYLLLTAIRWLSEFYEYGICIYSRRTSQNA